jgi:hypothetical protein
MNRVMGFFRSFDLRPASQNVLVLILESWTQMSVMVVS